MRYNYKSAKIGWRNTKQTKVVEVQGCTNTKLDEAKTKTITSDFEAHTSIILISGAWSVFQNEK